MHVTFDPYNFKEVAWMQANKGGAGYEKVSKQIATQ